MSSANATASFLSGMHLLGGKQALDGQAEPDVEVSPATIVDVIPDGKLVGAISYSFPFAKEPICGITPFEQMSSTMEQELERIRGTGIPSSVLWAQGDTLLPMRIGERAAELLGGSFEAIVAGDGWPGKRQPDHDWPLVGPEFFVRKVADTLRRQGGT